MAETLVDAAKSLVPMILSRLDQMDAECRLPPELASAMAEKQLFSLYAPKALGGPETDPITAFMVVEEISKADGSAGWCVFNGSAVMSAISRLTVEAAKEIFGDPPVLLGSGSARPEGTARLTEGGFLVSGRWDYLSGIDHSIALFLNCRVIDGEGPVVDADGNPVTRVAVVPVAAGTVLDTWTTLGMRGTASNDAEFFDVFVPASHTFTRGAPACHPGPLYNPSQTSILLSWTLSAANALGMARGAMDAFIDLATGSGSTDSKTLLRDRPHVQITVGECEAMLDGARSYLLDAIGSLWESQVEMRPDLTRKAARARLAITHAIRQSVAVVDKLFNAAGTNAIHHAVGLERYFRDLHVHGQHISGLPTNYEFGGSVLMGVTPRSSLYS